MEHWKKPGGLQMGTSIFCWACKISSGNVKGKGRSVGVHRHTELFLKESEGSKPCPVLPRLWLNTAFPNAPRRCSRLGTSGGCNDRKETLKKVVLLKKWQQIFLDLWVLLRKGWMASNKLSHVPFSTGLLTVTGKEKNTCPQRKSESQRRLWQLTFLCEMKPF